CMQALVFPWTF
nr:immunoglobulin light chain junction region [Macaca mulatta]MOX97938.1 immunoglobulin light chain junction region [Macaca mulatta]MOX98041.1 immunoglobulin light chain junction region [Macaca mulatta]MOX98183.1 immunoglobulin light chain junction region [Macaca mulatta]MOX98772.1 immunoglobulin light chain junction region [Macaca mulatta]